MNGSTFTTYSTPAGFNIEAAQLTPDNISKMTAELIRRDYVVGGGILASPVYITVTDDTRSGETVRVGEGQWLVLMPSEAPVVTTWAALDELGVNRVLEGECVGI